MRLETDAAYHFQRQESAKQVIWQDMSFMVWERIHPFQLTARDFFAQQIQQQPIAPILSMWQELLRPRIA